MQINEYKLAEILSQELGKTVTAPIPEHEFDTILYWDRAPKKNEGSYRISMYHNCSTGKQSESISSVIRDNMPFILIEKNSKDIYRTAGKAVEIEYNGLFDKVLMIVQYQFSTRAIKPGDIRTWEPNGLTFFTRGKMVIEEHSQKYSNNLSVCNYYSGSGMNIRYLSVLDLYKTDEKTLKIMENLKNYPMIIPEQDDFVKRHEKSSIILAAREVFPKIFALAGTSSGYLTDNYSLNSYLLYSECAKKTGPLQKKVDYLTLLKMDDVVIPKYKVLKNKKEEDDKEDNLYSWSRRDRIQGYAAIVKVNSEIPCCCLRTFAVSPENDVLETGRMYFEGKNKPILCKINNMGEWVPTNFGLHPSHWRYRMLEFSPDIAKGTRLEYYASIINEVEEAHRSALIYLFSKKPITEKLYKSGFNKVVEYSTTSCYDPMDTIRDVLGEINENGKKITDILEMNQYQIDYFTNHQLKVAPSVVYSKVDLLSRTAHDIKQGIEIKSIDNKSFDIIVESYIRIQNIDFYKILDEWGQKNFEFHPSRRYQFSCDTMGKNYFVGVIGKIASTYSLTTAIALIPKIEVLFTTLYHDEGRNFGYNNLVIYATNKVRLYLDYINMVAEMQDTEHFKPQFSIKNMREEIEEMHDTAVLIYNQKKDKIEDEFWTKMYPKWEKWEYENDSYMAIYPRHANELAKEGLALGHCVRNYITKVKENTTNIMFIRKKDDEETPFFTVEISNEGYIEQIHGKGNCNVSDVSEKEPLLENFITQWSKNKKLKLHGYNKVR